MVHAHVMQHLEVSLTCSDLAVLGVVGELRLHAVTPWLQNVDKGLRQSCEHDCLDPSLPSQIYQASHPCVDIAWQAHANGREQTASATTAHYDVLEAVLKTWEWNTALVMLSKKDSSNKFNMDL